MKNIYDIGIQSDFDNMTKELSTEIVIFPKEYSLTSESQEGSDTEDGFKKEEFASIQELNSKHEAVAAGIFDVGDLRVTFQSATTAVVEGYIEWNDGRYKILDLTKVRGLNNDVVTHVVGHGKKVPGR